MKRFLPSTILILGMAACCARAAESSILILVEGSSAASSPAVGEGRQLANLLGHFSLEADILGTNDYRAGMIRNYRRVFYIGFTSTNRPPESFLEDAASAATPLLWIHTGFVAFSSRPDVRSRLGFFALRMDSTGGFDRVIAGRRTFTREEPNIHLVEVRDPARVEVLASAVSSRTGKRTPYILRSGDFWYVADPPFSLATPTDRYLLFADLLHEVLGIPHEESRSAILRIEDINPLENPDRLRDIADLLARKGVPFLVGVSPVFVDPSAGLRVTLSQKPDIVDALKYMTRNGGTIIMHGVTHQYKGITGSDFEFWDEQRDGPIVGETADAHRRKIELGLREFMKNGLYPLLWETPHYAASSLLYAVVGEYFSTAMEQRLVIENSAYSQFFPYRIERDIYGQTIYPENLGYVPIDDAGRTDTAAASAILEGARSLLGVRDAVVGHFFHAFADLGELERIVDGIQGLGYTYRDVREDRNRAVLKDRVILSGTQSYGIELADQYLTETTWSRDGEIIGKTVSGARARGAVRRDVRLEPGRLYVAEPSEFRERERGWLERTVQKVQSLLAPEEPSPRAWEEARPLILWNHYARGAAFNDQASFAAAFAAVNIPVDTHFVGPPVRIDGHTIVVVPFGFVDSLRQEDYDLLGRYVQEGGCLITDTRNDLVEDLGFTFGSATLRVSSIQDELFPEERIVWRHPEAAVKFDTREESEVYASDQATGAPLAVFTRFGKGRILFFATRFDPLSHLGTTHYPFFLEYVRRAFGQGPAARRDDLEMFFDPGFRNNVTIEHLVGRWSEQGIRRIHVAAWHEYPRYTYDYDRLIRLAHGNGILVYAWLEPPQVTHKFWLEHPEWREKNHLGQDVRPSWRYPVAMTDPGCREAMIEHYMALLQRYPWDGVNIAELYFEAGRGFQDPHLWTPGHPSAVAEVERRFGFSIPSVFDERSGIYWGRNAAAREVLVGYRVETLEQIYRRLLDALGALRKATDGFEVIVTAMDAAGAPELREEIGVDMGSILKLQKEYGFRLCVQDPQKLWSTEPTRYALMGERYGRLLPRREDLMLDLNILAFRPPGEVTPFPTLIQTGTEAFHMIRSAAQGAPRVLTYAESSVNPQDMVFLPYAAVPDVAIRREGGELLVSSPRAFLMQTAPGVTAVAVDGVPVPSIRGNLFLVPAGERRITTSADPTLGFSDHGVQPRLLSATGNILHITYASRTVTFAYASQGRMLAMFDREPVSVLVDGVAVPFTPVEGAGGSAVFLPSGAHTAEIVAGDLVTYGVTMASLWSSRGIALFGLAASGLLVVLYVSRRVHRRRTATP
ncbi:MAG: DUF2334 domain-containing protein [Bacteroidota bacterium]